MPRPPFASAPDAYRDVVHHTAAMVQDREARALCRSVGLDVLDVTWEDTGRFKGSAVGPNISDMTIQVQYPEVAASYRAAPRDGLRAMPVIRYPSFADRSCDLPLDDLQVRVGNESGLPLRPVSLRTYLGDLRRFLSDPQSWAGRDSSLLAPRDTHVLVSAQACFLPVPRAGEARFNPVLFNYQSYPGSPAVLAVLATREGTSATVVDNARDPFAPGSSWGQRLFHNAGGRRASLTGQRLSDFEADAARDGVALPGDERDGLNMVLLIQVPLRQRGRPRAGLFGAETAACGAAPQSLTRRSRQSDVEAAVISHGPVEGPFTEVGGLAIERDERFPIRVTVQFYKATSNGVVSREGVAEIAEQIARVYADARYVGSLVTEGRTARPTEPDPGAGTYPPPGWWEDFWARHEATTGQSREQALVALWALRGRGWAPRSRDELVEALRQARARGGVG